MMKRLMIIVPSLEGGGQERIAALTSKILENEYEIVFVVFDDKESKFNISKRAEFINLNLPSSSNIFQKILNVIKRTQRIRLLRKQRKIDICYSIGRSANIINCLSKSRGKTIVSVRNSSKLETGEVSLINHLIYNMADAVICVSQGQKNKILKYYPTIKGKMFVVYNPCDIDFISSIRLKFHRLDDNNHIILSCGRLEGVKCYKNLVNAIKIVREKIKNVQLVVLGEGSQREELEKYIDKHSMGH